MMGGDEMYEIRCTRCGALLNYCHYYHDGDKCGDGVIKVFECDACEERSNPLKPYKFWRIS